MTSHASIIPRDGGLHNQAASLFLLRVSIPFFFSLPVHESTNRSVNGPENETSEDTPQSQHRQGKFCPSLALIAVVRRKYIEEVINADRHNACNKSNNEAAADDRHKHIL
jgi:hypothetical protein